MTRNTDPVIKALEQSLADTFTLALKTQNYHWNVVGSNFFSLHYLFEEQYKDGFAAADEIAERIRALGAPAPGGLRAFHETTTLYAAQDRHDHKALNDTPLDSQTDTARS